MNGISSYALKTVVMNMITENPNKDWKPSQKAELFLEVSGLVEGETCGSKCMRH